MDAGSRPFDGYYVIVPVWGQEYVRLFLEYGLPTHLSPRNIPAIAHLGCRYHILTHPEDVPTLEASSTIALLRTYAQVIIQPFTERDVYAGRADAPQGYNRSLGGQTWCYQEGLNRSRDLNVAYLFLTPDCLWADGCFYHAEEARQRGKRAVMITGLRLNKVNALEAIEAYREPGEANRDVLPIPPRNLVALTLFHLQATMVGNMMNIGIGRRSQNYHIWCVPGEGLLLRAFHPHPMMAWPTKKASKIEVTVDCRYAQKACPRDAIEMISDSDRGFCVDLADLYHTTHFVSLREKRLDQDLGFIISCTDDFHRWAATQDVILKTCEITPEKWAGPRAEATQFIDNLLAAYADESAQTDQTKRLTALTPSEPSVDRSPAPSPARARPKLIRLARRALRPVKRLVRGGFRLLLAPIYRQLDHLREQVESMAATPHPVIHGLQTDVANLRLTIDELLSEGRETGLYSEIARINGMLIYAYWVLNYGRAFEEAAKPARKKEQRSTIRLAS